MVMTPVRTPLAVGVKVTAIVQVFPAATGVEIEQVVDDELIAHRVIDAADMQDDEGDKHPLGIRDRFLGGIRRGVTHARQPFVD